MTNQEAIEELQLTIDLIKQNGKDWLDERDIPILSMAIEAMKELNALREQNSPSRILGTSEDVVSINAIILKLNTMDRYVSEELRLCDTEKRFPKNEVFIVDDVYEEIVDRFPSVQPEIVMCKDCKHWHEHKYAKETKRYMPFCGFNAIYTKSDDFCSRAERQGE